MSDVEWLRATAGYARIKPEDSNRLADIADRMEQMQKIVEAAKIRIAKILHEAAHGSLYLTFIYGPDGTEQLVDWDSLQQDILDVLAILPISENRGRQPDAAQID